MRRLAEKETHLVELKAKVDDLVRVRRKLKELNAEYVGTFTQKDTYYAVPQGRLKLRETGGEEKAQLVYYERPDLKGPKTSRVFILEIKRQDFLRAFIEKTLEKKVVVEKQREIYRYQGTQIHLDTVKELGTYIEFEKPTENTSKAISQARRDLEKLMSLLGVKKENLQTGSYSDIIQKTG